MKAKCITTDELLDLHDAVLKLADRAKSNGPYHVADGLMPVAAVLRDLAKKTALDEAFDRRRSAMAPQSAEQKDGNG